MVVRYQALSLLVLFGFCAAIALLAPGCGSADSPIETRLAELRTELLLDEEPETVLGVLEARESLTERNESEVTILGQIGGLPKPWAEGQAAFVLADPSLSAVEGEHDGQCGDGCAFCAKKKERLATDGLALVEFLDAEGNILPIDARKLFSLTESPVVIVRGRATLDKLGQLKIAASGLYIRE